MKYTQFVGVFFLALIGCNTPQRPIQQDPLPNIIFILADDMGYGDVAFLNPESKIPTPNLDQLARQGMSFNNAHAPAAVCTPTRYGFLTGMYPWRSKMKRGVSWLWDPPLIDGNQFTVGKMLQAKGYETACIGKWHLGWDWPTTDGESPKASGGKNVDYTQSIKNGPLAVGFDYYFGDDVPSFPPHAFIENDRMVEIPTDWLEPGSAGAPGAMMEGWKYENLLPSISDKSIDWISISTKNRPDQPFFLFYSLSAPHTPIAPNDAFLGTSSAGRYGDFVVEIDHHMGKLLKTLDSLGIAENTLVIFTSDNGPTNMDGENYVGEVGSLLAYGHSSGANFKGLKADSWEAGHREPFLVRWPGSVTPGSTSDALVSLSDMMATFAAIIDYDLPDSIGGDSFDLLPLFTGKDSTERQNLIVQSGNGILSFIGDDWKLITSSGGGGLWSGIGELAEYDSISDEWKNVQLYDLSKDPDESENLADRYPERVAGMMSSLAEQIREGRSTEGPRLADMGSSIWPEVRWLENLK